MSGEYVLLCGARKQEASYFFIDPRDDLIGMLDVARKALILARPLGHRINMDNIKVNTQPNVYAHHQFHRPNNVVPY
ncbi:hypothetical protein PHJA_002354400 [Phtheirospermum japonicum]|uniref:Homoserine dehydrogenase catalytic domain-containing protein n=1 Tax=Phtheirospermum japonicum TaxID=374723 RepID=A0A830D0Z2_9LAMI|nr:hypothetical protein PHJA_002354400 [Phtheirospermum japonicum]